MAGGCIISGATVRRSLISSKVRVENCSYVEDSVILPEVMIGRDVTLKRAVVDKYCRIPDGMTVGVDPEEDRRRFHVTERGVTLVCPHMLRQAGAVHAPTTPMESLQPKPIVESEVL